MLVLDAVVPQGR